MGMIDPSRLAFDIDDVFADTMGLFLQIARSDYQINHIRHEDITSYMIEECVDAEPRVLEEIFNRIVDGDYRVPLRPVEGAPGVIERIGREHRPVLFVTARPRGKTIADWMRCILKLEPTAIDVVATGSFEAKVGVLLERNITDFVEDRLETCFLLKEAGLNPILFKRPWNRKPHPFQEVASWRELESLVAFNGECC